MSNPGRIRVTQIRGAAGKRQRHKACLRGLGLRRPRQVVELEDTLAIRGMIHKVRYMVEVEEVSSES